MTGVQQAKRQARQLWILGAAFALFILAIGLPVYLNYQRSTAEASQSRQQKADLQCVTDWANATAARADEILTQSKAKNDASDQAFRALAAIVARAGHVTAADVRMLSAKLNAYQSASNDLNNSLTLHPLPPSPRLACGGNLVKDRATPTPIVVTKTAPGGVVTLVTPGATTIQTATITEPIPTTVTAPGVTQPAAPARTVTITRTVTRTVAPPPCLKKLTLPCTLAR